MAHTNAFQKFLNCLKDATVLESKMSEQETLCEKTLYCYGVIRPFSDMHNLAAGNIQTSWREAQHAQAL